MAKRTQKRRTKISTRRKQRSTRRKQRSTRRKQRSTRRKQRSTRRKLKGGSAAADADRAEAEARRVARLAALTLGPDTNDDDDPDNRGSQPRRAAVSVAAADAAGAAVSGAAADAAGAAVSEAAADAAGAAVSVPPSFNCPISHGVMHDPVTLSDGHSYERTEIERWLMTKNTSPMTGAKLKSKAVVPNHALRNSIREHFQASGCELPPLPPPPIDGATAPADARADIVSIRAGEIELERRAAAAPPDRAPRREGIGPGRSMPPEDWEFIRRLGSGSGPVPPLPRSVAELGGPGAVCPYEVGDPIMYRDTTGTMQRVTVSDTAQWPPFVSVQMPDGEVLSTVLSRLKSRRTNRYAPY